MMSLILYLLVHNYHLLLKVTSDAVTYFGKRNLDWVVGVTGAQDNVTLHAWMSSHDQAMVKGNLAKLIHLLEMRVVSPRLSPSTISQICPPLKLGGKEHTSRQPYNAGPTRRKEYPPGAYRQRGYVMPTHRTDSVSAAPYRFNVTCFVMGLSPDLPFPHPAHPGYIPM